MGLPRQTPQECKTCRHFEGGSKRRAVWHYVQDDCTECGKSNGYKNWKAKEEK